MTLSTTDNLSSASPQNFRLVFPLVPPTTDIGDNKDLTLNIFSTIIPNATLEMEERKWMGGTVKAPLGKMSFEPWTVNFMVDSDFANWRLLFRWLRHINNGSTKWIDLDSNFMIDASFQALDNWGTRIFEVIFYNLWINGLGEVVFTYREGEPYLEAQATFSYSHYNLNE